MQVGRNEIFDISSVYYDLFYSAKDYAKEAEYVSSLIRSIDPHAKSILELGSGTGNHAAYLCAHDYKIMGIEVNEQMIARSLEKRIEGFEVEQGDICHFELSRQFDVVIALFHVISYLNHNDDVLSCFRTVANHLKPGGCFIFDVWYSPAVYTQKPEVRTKQFLRDSKKIVRHSIPEINHERNTVNVHYLLEVYDVLKNTHDRLSEMHPMRHFSTPEIDLLAQMAGLKRIKVEEFLTKNTPSDDTWGVCYTLKKI